MTLFNLHKKYFSKGKSHFLKIYEDYFFPFKNKKINILEIGVYEGKSLMIWKDYFPKANIIGVDLLSYNFKIKRIFTFQGDQTDTKFLFDYLVDGGLYIAEDLQTSYFPRYGGSRLNLRKTNTSLNFFKTLVDSGNFEMNDRPFYKRNKFDGNIKFIHFYQNLMILKKGKTDSLQYSNLKTKYSFIDFLKKIISKFYL